jgi:peptidoglycan/xylan/chitin deacetylase (PgdA/CDA1 family)
MSGGVAVAAGVCRLAGSSGALAVLERLDARRVGVLRALTYHSVTPPGHVGRHPGVVSATPEDFERQMLWLTRRFRPLSLREVLAARRKGRDLPPGAALVTFDDGYADFAENAWPVMRRLGVPATLFVPTAYPGRRDRSFWWDRVHRAFATTTRSAALDSVVGRLELDTPARRRSGKARVFAYVKQTAHERAMQVVDEVCEELGVADAGGDVLSWDQLRSLARDGVDVCAHTRSHALLDRVPAERAAAEVAGSFDDLERELGSVPPVFAYPDGRVSAAALEALQGRGVELAFTTRRGVDHLGGADPLLLRRVNVSRHGTEALLRAQMLSFVPGSRRASAGGSVASAGDAAAGPTLGTSEAGRAALSVRTRRQRFGGLH